MQQAVAPIVHELARNANIFLITHVIDDVGEATVRGALEDVGLVGNSEGQIKSHRLVFCSTLEGKVSIVRQLEPDLHIDGHPTTVRAPNLMSSHDLCIHVCCELAQIWRPHSCESLIFVCLWHVLLLQIDSCAVCLHLDSARFSCMRMAAVFACCAGQSLHTADAPYSSGEDNVITALSSVNCLASPAFLLLLRFQCQQFQQSRAGKLIQHVAIACRWRI